MNRTLTKVEARRRVRAEAQARLRGGAAKPRRAAPARTIQPCRDLPVNLLQVDGLELHRNQIQTAQCLRSWPEVQSREGSDGEAVDDGSDFGGRAGPRGPRPGAPDPRAVCADTLKLVPGGFHHPRLAEKCRE